MIDEVRLEKIRARCEAATPGPWKAISAYWLETEDEEQFRVYDIENQNGDVTIAHTSVLIGKNDADFIARARQDVPDLLDAIDNLQAENERLRETLERAEKAVCFGTPANCDSHCQICGRYEGHSDHCPFKVLES